MRPLQRFIDGIDLDAAVREEVELERLLRLIVLTERRGLSQVRALLGAQRVLLDRELRHATARRIAAFPA